MTEINLEELRNGARELGIELDPTAQERFALFAAKLYEANEKQNLTRVPPEQFVGRHALESLHPVWALFGAVEGPVVDVGTGAGFPGLPIKIAMPSLPVTLVDSHGKATAFLQRLVEELGLSDVSVVSARGEDITHTPEHRERYGLAVCRAVGGLRVVTELLSGLVRVGGVAVPHRTSADGEIPAEHVDALGFALERTAEVGELRYPVLRKDRPLDAAYPRPWSQLRRAVRQ